MDTALRVKIHFSMRLALRSRKVLPIILTLSCTYKIVIKKWIETWLKLSRIFFAKKLSIESTIPTLKVSIQNFCFLSLSLWEMFAAKNIIQSNSTWNFTFKYIRNPTSGRLPRGPLNDGPEPSIRGPSIKDAGRGGAKIPWNEVSFCLFLMTLCRRAIASIDFFPPVCRRESTSGIIIRFNKNGLSVKQWTVACRTGGYHHRGRC